jgi:hypothetical protein
MFLIKRLLRYNRDMDDTQIEKILDTLAPNIKNAIKLFDWVGVIKKISEKHKLHIDDFENLRQISLMVAIGELPSQSYADMLQNKFLLTEDQVNSLVADANTLIFTELQKTAFSKTESSSIHDTLKDEGILLIDEHDTSDPYTDITPTKEPSRENTKKETYVPKYRSPDVPSSGVPNVNEIPKTPNYNEPIEISDLAGITKHRTPYTHHESEKISDTNLGKALYTNVHISKGDTFNVSPTHESQVKEDGDFLKHITPE